MRIPGLFSLTSAHHDSPRESTREWWCVLALILVVATILRAEKLGKPSYWYDEVVTIRIATAPDIPAMLALLEKTDATRAILHPLLLHGWVRVFGSSEAAARAFSVVCGVLTVAWVARLGRILSGQPRTGLWAAWLTALSPALIYNAREVRMYALLVLLSCVAWDALLALRNGPTFSRLFIYSAVLTALMYSHSLGLLMASALALASLIVRRELGLSWKRWLAPYLASALGIAPWIRRYFDHPPEYIIGRKPITVALNNALGFLGGNNKILLGFLVLMVVGLLALRREASGRRRIVIDSRLAAVCLLCWLLVPTLLLIIYSWFSHPIFGPPRYSLYVAPAYILVLATGDPGLGKAARRLLASLLSGWAITALMAVCWPGMVYAPDLKPQWRAAAAELDRRDPSRREAVGVISSFTPRNFEVETARYYLSPHRKAYPVPGPLGQSLPSPTSRAWLAVGYRDGKPTAKMPEHFRAFRDDEPILVPGLCLIAVEPDPRILEPAAGP